MAFLTEEEKTIIRCAYADLVGALQAYQAQDRLSHDWDAHTTTIMEMETAFPFLERVKIEGVEDPI